jgi:hypothetical protein
MVDRMKAAAACCVRGVSVALVAVAALYCVAAPVAAIAQADTCTYALSAPQLTTANGGGVQVTASLTPKECGGNAIPSIATVCVSSEGSGGRCATSYAWGVAQVFVDPIASSRYVSTGTACLNRGIPPTMACVGYGPVRQSG